MTTAFFENPRNEKASYFWTYPIGGFTDREASLDAKTC